jgi:DNA ligase (NAD+)
MRLLIVFAMLLQLSCLAATPSVREQATYLQTILRRADEAYYNRGEPIMGDTAYDALRAQYERLLAQYPEIGRTGGVGVPVADGEQKVAHSAPVLSLQKAYSDAEVERFLSRCGRERRYCVELKIDGLSLVLRFRDGLLVKAITRGDGQEGVDATAALLASGAVPHMLNSNATVEVRGELFLPFPAFEALNEQRVQQGNSLLKSPRNSAAGSLRLDDFGEIARRGLEFRAFELRMADPMPPTHDEALAAMRSMGLQTVASRTVPSAEVIAAIAEVNRERTGIPFETDGIVVRLNDRAAFEALGATAHHPRGALARKYKEIPVETRLLSVAWQRGETGRLTPVACFEPVELQGALVQRANLHNLEHVRALDLRIGDWVQVVRAGGAVPEIVCVNTARRTGGEQPVPAPPGL